MLFIDFVSIAVAKMHSVVIVIFMSVPLAPVVLANVNRNSAFLHEAVIVVLQVLVALK